MPDWRAEIRTRLAGLRLAPTREADIVEELAQHLADRYAALLAGGLPPAEAARRTRLEIAGREAFAARLQPLRQAQVAPPLPPPLARWSAGAFVLDLRHAARGLRRDWAFTAAVVMTLALCIGATTAVATAAQALLLRPLGFDGSTRVVNVWLSRSGRPNWHFRVPSADVRVIASSNRVFDGVGLYDTQPMNLAGDGPPEEIATAVVSAGFLRLLHADAAVGRILGDGDEMPGRGRVVLLGDGLWRRRFGAQPDVVGRDIHLDGVPYRVVGVAPRGFTAPGRSDAWIPRDGTDGGANAFLLARLRPGVSIERANADMAVMVSAITNGRPNPGMRFDVELLQTSLTRASRGSWLLLLAAVVCVLGIGCVDVSILMLARGLRRRRDIEVRLALGATRAQIVRLFAAESLWLAAGGGTAALLVAWAGVHGLRALLPLETPQLSELALNPVATWIALATTACAASAFGLLPALRGSRGRAEDALKGAGAPAAAGRAAVRLQAGLIVGQMALALMLLAGTAMLGRSLLRLSDVHLGFDPDRLLTVRLNAPGRGSQATAERLAAVARLLEQVRGLPAVTSATAATGPVLAGWGLPDASRTLAQRLTVEGGPVVTGRPEEANLRRVDSGYFETLGIAVRHGRTFSNGDQTGGRLVAIVNRTMARTVWSIDAPIGRRFAFDRDGGAPRWLEIVGVVDDTRDIAPTEAPAPAFFVPLGQHTRDMDADQLHLYLRTATDPLALADQVREVVWRLDPAQPVDVSTMALAVEQFHRAPRFRTAVLGGLALLGLLLAMLGTHAVVAHAVGQRRAEIAVRVALGAGRSAIVRSIVLRTLVLTALAALVGLAGAVLLGRVARGLFFDIAPIDATSLVAATALLVAVVLATAYPIARRAGGTDPVRALRPDAG